MQFKYYNRGAKELSPLRKDDVVRIKPRIDDKTRRWTKCHVIEQAGMRSYKVKTEDGKILQRNRKFLRLTKESFNSDVEDEIDFPVKEQETTDQHQDKYYPEDEPMPMQEAPQLNDTRSAQTTTSRAEETRFDYRQFNFYEPIVTRRKHAKMVSFLFHHTGNMKTEH